MGRSVSGKGLATDLREDTEGYNISANQSKAMWVHIKHGGPYIDSSEKYQITDYLKSS